MTASASWYVTTAVCPRLLRHELRSIARVLVRHPMHSMPEPSLLNVFAQLLDGTPATAVSQVYDPEVVERAFGHNVIHPELSEGELAAVASRRAERESQPEPPN